MQRAIDEARVQRRDLDRFFNDEDRLDGFFIRALEQVQGDERDVIIFSVGYGPDEAGKVSTNFGALNKQKGWRRLNVGITRVRQRVEVFASMHPGQIRATQNENVEYFRAYLEYAERGVKMLAVPYSSTGLDPESPFEESVIAAIQGWGYEVEPQVGAAGYRIDMGVRHPDYPGLFALGVECDGYQYHSAPAARDRDRLRDMVLTGLGWQLHRIWGTAWYRDRPTEEARLRKVIEEALATSPRGPERAPRIEREAVETEPAQADAPRDWIVEYVTAPSQHLGRWVDPGEEDAHLSMVEPLTKLVMYEAPVHIDTVHQRVRDWWDIGRVGSKIRQNMDRAIRKAGIRRDADFLLADSPVARVRTPSSSTSRSAAQVHSSELAVAVTNLVREAGAISRPELVQSAARIFGWARTGLHVERAINDVVDQMVRDAVLINENGSVRSASE